MARHRILIVEDQVKLLNALQQGLAEEQFDVLTAVNAETGFFMAVTQDVSLIVLDRMLPGRDGLEILKELRRTGYRMPVLLLTARDQVHERIDGLNAGADDYLVKPFEFGELLARIRALLRRGEPRRPLILKAGDLELDLLARRVIRAGEEIVLSPREFELLEYLMQHCNQTVTREELSREVWKEPAVLTNVIDVCVMQLRRKIERPELRQLICTVRGAGYVLREPS